MKVTTRRRLATLHRVLGLSLGGVLIIQAITGTAIAFRQELTRLLHPTTVTTVGVEQQPAPLSRIVREIHEHSAEGELRRLHAPHGATDLYQAQLAVPADGLRLMTLDPYTSQVLRTGPLAAFPLEAALHIHKDLLAGAVGHMIVGVLGIVICVIGVLGLWLWWPGRRHLRQSLRIHPASPLRRRLFDLHRVTGALSGIVLVLLSLTGAGIALHGLARQLVSSVATVQPPPTFQNNDRQPLRLDRLDAALALAQATVGGESLHDWQFDGVHRFRFHNSSVTRPEALDSIWVDGNGERVLATRRADTAATGDAALAWLYPIHSGKALGTVGQSIVAISGLTIAFVVICGLMLWWDRRKARNASRSTPR